MSSPVERFLIKQTLQRDGTTTFDVYELEYVKTSWWRRKKQAEKFVGAYPSLHEAEGEVQAASKRPHVQARYHYNKFGEKITYSEGW